MDPPSQNPYAPPTSDPSPIAGANFGDRPLASRGARFLGSLIDGVMQGAIYFAVVWFTNPSIYSVGGSTFREELFATFVFAAAFLTINGYLLATRGKTVGKLVMRTTTIDLDSGEIPPFGSLLLRRYVILWLVGLIPVLGAILQVLDALMIFRQNRRCLHDEIANTVVVRD